MEHQVKNAYITSTNIISSLGFTTQENIDAISLGQSGVKPVDAGLISDAPIPAGLIDNLRLNKLVRQKQLTGYSKPEQLIILSVENLLAQKQIDIKQCGILISTTKGNIDLLSKQTNDICKDVYLRNSASKITSFLGMRDEAMVVSNACISGVSALIIARRFLMAGKYPHVIVVGVDVLSRFITSGFQSFQSLSETVCRPYDASRDGLNLGEACGSILLSTEHEPNAIMLRGGAISNDANHISGPSRTGDGLFQAIDGAMEEAGVTATDIDFVNLHGTATVFNDEMEAKAIRLARLSAVPANSLKPYFGHTLGASGVIETIACVHQLTENTMFGTLNYGKNGVSMPLNVQANHLKLESPKTCIKTASGFGGCNAAIVLSKLPGCGKQEAKAFSFNEIKTCTIENSTVKINGKTVFTSHAASFPEFIKEAYKSAADGYQKFYKMDDLCKLGYIAARHLLEGVIFDPAEMGIILSNSSSSLGTDANHQRMIDKGGDHAASPATFVYTLANIVAGEICIRHKIRGENTFFIEHKDNLKKQDEYTELAMAAGSLNLCITGWCECFDNNYKAELRLVRKDMP